MALDLSQISHHGLLYIHTGQNFKVVWSIGATPCWYWGVMFDGLFSRSIRGSSSSVFDDDDEVNTTRRV